MAGSDGKVTYSSRVNGKVQFNVDSTAPGAEADVCINWRNGTGCRCVGHWFKFCPNASASKKTVQATGTAGTGSDDNAAMLETLTKIAESLGVSMTDQGSSLTWPLQVVTVNSQRT